MTHLDDSGKPKFIRLYIQDITELDRLEQERDFSHKLTNKIVNHEVNISDLKKIMIDIQNFLGSWEIGIVTDKQLLGNIFLKKSSKDNKLYENKKDEYIFWNHKIWQSIINACPEVSSASVNKNGLIAACGHTIEHWLH